VRKIHRTMTDNNKLRTFYPLVEPYETGRLKVSDVHELHYEICGKKEGYSQTAVFVHGGPGGGVSDYNRQYFNPDKYRLILFDQRGCGKSTPYSCLQDNTTWHLVEDMEKLRKHLGIKRWVVFGGSWGSTLAIAYAQKYPDTVKALILRGIFTLRRKELLWFYQDGASFMFPDFWDKYLEPIPVVERGDLMSAYHRRLTGDNAEVRKKCAEAWTLWEMGTSRLFVDPDLLARGVNIADAFARIECHYFVNGGFFEYEGQLIEEATKISHIPTVIVQGRYDVVCPAVSAWDLHKKMPKSELKIIPDAGHSAKEPGIVDELIKATDKFAEEDKDN